MSLQKLVREAQSIDITELLIESPSEQEYKILNVLYTKLRSRDEEDVIYAVNFMSNKCEQDNFQKIMMKVRPTFYTFILSKEFENRNEILDEIISYLQTMNIEIDEHKDFCIKYDKYFIFY